MRGETPALAGVFFWGESTPKMACMELDASLVQRLARVALTNVATENPCHLSHLARDEADCRPPRELYPVFWGSYDWHSCVHMHWSLVRLLRLAPAHALARATHDHFDSRLSPAVVAGEIDYFSAPGRTSFERPYGWSWLLKLQAELIALARTEARAGMWRDALAPLAQLVAERWLDFLPRADFPVRAGTHGNSAFALLLALDWARATQHLALQRQIEHSAHRWFGRDRSYPAAYEPGGDDFLAAGLVEAVLMRRVIDSCSFGDWWEAFAPGETAAPWLTPVRVADPGDPKIVHLHGVNLCRAWCWRELAGELDAPAAALATTAVESHLAESLAAASRGDYVGTHWLASFALLALTEPRA